MRKWLTDLLNFTCWNLLSFYFSTFLEWDEFRYEAVTSCLSQKRKAICNFLKWKKDSFVHILLEICKRVESQQFTLCTWHNFVLLLKQIWIIAFYRTDYDIKRCINPWPPLPHYNISINWAFNSAWFIVGGSKDNIWCDIHFAFCFNLCDII